MKKLVFIFILIAYTALLFNLSHAATLTTKNYVVDITHNCEEGVVACDDVTYIGKSKRSGASIELKGQTWHLTCADGISPCRFIGYIFKNGDITYKIYESGTLRVTHEDGRILVDETGEWSY